jgi:hypothetical protein
VPDLKNIYILGVMMEITVEETVLTYEPTFKFDGRNPNWVRMPDYNVVFLRQAQNYLNEQYRIRGHLFLNEVFDILGFPRTGAGAVLGWVFGENEDVLLDWELNEDGSFDITVNPPGTIFDQIDPAWM